MNRIILSLFMSFLICSVTSAEILSDNLADNILKDKNIEKPEANLNYDFQSTERYILRLKSLEEISSETKAYEGQTVNFITDNNIYYKGELIVKSGTIVPARIETIVKNGMNGIPASLIIGNFQIENIRKGQLTDFHEIRGLDLSLWVFPLKWALTILPPTGSLTNFIKGGHAKLKKGQKIELYYNPNWVIEKNPTSETDLQL